jgi:L-ascorbate metabolism protein UlaG (beta-lactamase superfamily)
MDPKRAAEALTYLKPLAAVPIHWGTFYPRYLGWLRANLMVDPPQIFLREAQKQMPNVEIHILQPGEAITL